jgi:hypothetical protein
MLAVRLVMKVEVHTVGTVDLQTRFKAQIVDQMQGFGARGQTENEVEDVRDPCRHSSPPHATRGGRLPTFLLIGAAKSGTTSLYKYLKQHPQIFMSGLKEPNYLAFGDRDIAFGNPKDNKFLNRVAVKDLPSYARLFADATDERAIGEASGSSLYMPGAHRRIRQLLPAVKLIAVLRDPVERAYSQFLYFRGLGAEPVRRFERAVSLEARRIEQRWAPYWFYTANGFYHRQLKPFVDTFGADRIRVYLYEDLVTRPRDILADMFRFLDVDDRFRVDLTVRHNVSQIPLNRIPDALKAMMPWWHAIEPSAPPRVRNAIKAFGRDLLRRNTGRGAPIRPEFRKHLQAVFREDTARLQDLIGRDLTSWQN